ncbi:MAG: ABC transporter ATP-binding protein [Rectinemataceae bacterium]
MSDIGTTRSGGGPARGGNSPSGHGGGGGFGGRGGGFGGGGHGMAMSDEKARNFKGTMRRLLAYLGSYKIAIIAVLIISLASTLFSILGPKILGTATTKLFEGVMAMASGKGGIDFGAIGRIVLITLGLYILSAAFTYVRGWIMAGISTKISYRLRKDISEKIDRLPLRYFDATTHGELLSRITNDVDAINQTLSQSLMQLISSAVTVVGVVAMMFSISWILALVALVIMPISLLVVTGLVKKSQKLFKEQQAYLGQVNGHVEEMYGAHLVIKAFNAEKRSIEAFEGYNAKLYGAARSSQFISGLMMPLMSLVANLGYVVIAILGGSLALRKIITVGDIQAFIQYINSFSHPLAQIASISSVLQQTAAAAERVFEFLEEDEEADESETPVEMEKPEGRVEFKNIRFGYTPEKLVIKDFSALAEKGHKIAIVGPTGAGKTTMVKLLMRFYEADSGVILVDGVDIKELRRKDLRKLFGMVLQDTWLFNGTIRDNIRYGRPDATEAEVIEAAKTAHADHFIRALPQGYDMVINEEASNISQGQKQLLTVARAVLADPAMLILDEATSSIDTRTELLIQKAMDELMRNRTSFIIAHRLSTVKNADLILVMKDGDIVEQGRHERLLEKGGLYAEIYESQFDSSVPADERVAV